MQKKKKLFFFLLPNLGNPLPGNSFSSGEGGDCPSQPSYNWEFACM